MVEELCGQSPSEKNFKAFIEHNPDLILGHPSGLDPKRAQAFNYPSVKAHFDLLQDTINLNDMPTCNIFNMDEIGIQIGSGRKRLGELFFYGVGDQSQYQLKSTDLELVTILEMTCMDGSAPVKPCFVFQGKLFCKE